MARIGLASPWQEPSVPSVVTDIRLLLPILVELVREGVPLPHVQAQLGHSSLSVTSRYLAHVTPEDLSNQARSRPRWHR